MITKEDLEKMPKGTVFAQGELPDGPDGINMTTSGRMLRWVAVRGAVPDWAIYCHFAENTWEYIRSVGDKVHDEENIRRCVDVDDTAMKMYRH